VIVAFISFVLLGAILIGAGDKASKDGAAPVVIAAYLALAGLLAIVGVVGTFGLAFL
jgi:hypothetical protein